MNSYYGLLNLIQIMMNFRQFIIRRINANFRKIALMFVGDELFRASETKLKAVLGVYGKKFLEN